MASSENNSPKYDERPWGNFTVLDEANGYKVKRIEVLPGKRLSYQKHAQRAEHDDVLADLDGRRHRRIEGPDLALRDGEPARQRHLAAELAVGGRKGLVEPTSRSPWSRSTPGSRGHRRAGETRSRTPDSPSALSSRAATSSAS